MRDYQKLDVWKKAHLLTLHIYQVIIPEFPLSEKYDLCSQMKRAAYSIPLNIVEGAGRRTEKDFTHFLDIALGSAQELEYICFLAKDLKYLENKYEEISKKVDEVKAMLIGLIKHLRP